MLSVKQGGIEYHVRYDDNDDDEVAGIEQLHENFSTCWIIQNYWKGTASWDVCFLENPNIKPTLCLFSAQVG